MSEVDLSDPEFRKLLDEFAALWKAGAKDDAFIMFRLMEDSLGIARPDDATHDATHDALSDILSVRIGPLGLIELGMLQTLSAYGQLIALAYTSAVVSDDLRSGALADANGIEAGFDEMERIAYTHGIEFKRPARRGLG